MNGPPARPRGRLASDWRRSRRGTAQLSADWLLSGNGSGRGSSLSSRHRKSGSLYPGSCRSTLCTSAAKNKLFWTQLNFPIVSWGALYPNY